MANLITLEEYKTIESLSSSKEDAKINSIIASVSGLIKTYCNTSFVDYVETPITQTLTLLSPTNILFLKETPLIELVSISQREKYSTTYTTVDSSKYFYDENTDSVILEDGYWNTGPSVVKAVYKAGYVSLPEELKIATANLVTYYMKEQFKTTPQTIAGASLVASTDDNKPAFPGHIKRVLNQYRSVL